MLAKTKEVVACEKARRLAFNSLKKLEFGFLELFVGFFMIIGLIGYFWSLPADLDWLDHTVAFLMFSYFFYILNITSILFGRTVKIANFLAVISYLSFFFKDIIAYTEANAFKFTVLKFIDDVYLFFHNNLTLTTLITFYIGLIGIFVVSIYLTKKIEISNPSFLYALYTKPFKNKLIKFLLIFIALLAFYYLIYNPILEWLEFVLDDPVVAIGIVFYIVLIAKHHHKFNKKNIIFKIGDTVWGWYKKFISLFHYKKTIPLAISGLLILHAVSDLGVFAYSMVFSKENFYLEFLSEEHMPFIKLFLEDAKYVDVSTVISLFIVYLLNALSLIVLLLVPVIVWVRIFLQKELHFNRVYLFFIFSSVTAYILLPGYVVKPLSENSITGVDIASVSLLESKSVLDNFFPNKASIVIAVSLVSLILGLMVYALASNFKIRKEFYALSIIGGLTFYTIYLYYFFSSLMSYFYDNIIASIITPHFFIGITLLIFFILSIIFYIGGYLMFLYEVVMEYHNKKWSEPIDEELFNIIKNTKNAKNRMLKARKSQYVGDVLKYAFIAFVSMVILFAGYKIIVAIKEKACKTEIAKFEIETKDMDKGLRFGAKELQNYEVPCQADKIYFFDLSKEINPENFDEIPVIKDAIKSKTNDNVFLVKEGKVKHQFNAGNLEIEYPNYKCFLPNFNKIEFFLEGISNAAFMTAASEQPECTELLVDTTESEEDAILNEAVSLGIDVGTEKSKIAQTKENVRVTRTFNFQNNKQKTKVDIKIKVNQGITLEEFRFYESIPKECINDLTDFLEEIEEDDVEVEITWDKIKPDPLIMWNFDEVKGTKKISYKLDKELSEECRELIKGLAVAQIITRETEGEG